MGMAALVLGILGIVLCWIPFAGWAGILLALAGAVLGVLTLRKGLKDDKWMAIASLPIGVVAIAYGLFIQISWIRGAQYVGEQYNQVGQILDDAKVKQTLEQLQKDAQKAAVEAARQQQPASSAPVAAPPAVPPAQ
ncbi:MAG: hypothetical protein PHU25_00585 [Deltaproteobacteria bacterium]|nr:hypothetical protein [Deltaproteobacteria bacterium]